MTDSKTATELIDELRSTSLSFPPAIRRKVNMKLGAIEQAIAATLGSGTLTAEHVRKAIEKRFDFDVWVPTERWHAIADELNAELKARDGECENVSDPPSGFLCSACGWGDFSEPSHLLTTAKYTGRESGGPNFCPNCGKAVKR